MKALGVDHVYVFKRFARDTTVQVFVSVMDKFFGRYLMYRVRMGVKQPTINATSSIFK